MFVVLVAGIRQGFAGEKTACPPGDPPWSGLIRGKGAMGDRYDELLEQHFELRGRTTMTAAERKAGIAEINAEQDELHEVFTGLGAILRELKGW